MRKCPRCSLEKSYEDFYFQKGKAQGWCKSCMSIYYSEKAKTPQRRKKQSEATSKWRKNNLEKARRLDRAATLKQYGLTIEQYEEMFEAQNGKCFICDREPPIPKNGRKPYLVVDHNHITGKVRRLLCIRCNSHLGWYETFQSKITDYEL